MNRRKLDTIAWVLVWLFSLATFGTIAAALTWRFAWAVVCMFIVCAVGVCYARVDRRIRAIEERFALRSRRGPERSTRA